MLLYCFMKSSFWPQFWIYTALLLYIYLDTTALLLSQTLWRGLMRQAWNIQGDTICETLYLWRWYAWMHVMFVGHYLCKVDMNINCCFGIWQFWFQNRCKKGKQKTLTLSLVFPISLVVIISQAYFSLSLSALIL